MRRYKVVGGPQEIIVKQGEIGSAYQLFENIINNMVNQGWEYHSMEKIAITEKPGCFQKPVTLYSYMLIFYRDE